MRRAACLVLVAACGGGAGIVVDGAPGADGPAVDARVAADARTDCPVPPAYVAPSAAGASASRDGDGVITLAVEVDDDRFEMRLERRGVFLDGPVAGTYPIAGAQLDNASCALCLLVFAGTPEEVYFATGGLVRLDSVSGRLTGALTDVHFEHVTLAADPPHESTPVRDGCVTRISSMSFDVALPP